MIMITKNHFGAVSRWQLFPRTGEKVSYSPSHIFEHLFGFSEVSAKTGTTETPVRACPTGVRKVRHQPPGFKLFHAAFLSIKSSPSITGK